MDRDVLRRTRDCDRRSPHRVGVRRKFKLELDGRVGSGTDVPGSNEVLFIGLLFVRQEPVSPHSDLCIFIRCIRDLSSPLSITDGIGCVLEWGRTGSLSDQSAVPYSSAITSPPRTNYWEYASHYLARLTITVPDGVPSGTGSSGPRTIIFGISGIFRLSTFSLSFRYPLSHGMISSRISAPGGFS